MLSKKGIISVNLFVLTILLFLMLLGFATFYKDFTQNKFDRVITKQEVTNSALSLRSFLVSLTPTKNQTGTYIYKYDSEEVILELSNSTIKSTIYSDEVISTKINTYNIEFCSDYTISPVFKNYFVFNGTCMSYII